MDGVAGFIIIAGVIFAPAIYFWFKYTSANKDLEQSRIKIQMFQLKLEETEQCLHRDKEKADKLLTEYQTEAAGAIHEFESISKKVTERLVKVAMDSVRKGLTPGNFSTSIKKLDSVFSFLDKLGVNVDKKNQRQLHAEIQSRFEEVVRKDESKRMQAEIKARIREEQREEKLREQEIKLLDREMMAIQRALAKALKLASDEHDVQVQALRDRLLVAETKKDRAISMAQLTRTGHVYIISNIGSFGENIYKVGMTRRLEPLDRVKELGDASVPFPFDVHAMISSDDAPKLEHNLHLALKANQVNKVNSRKEFFRADLEHIIGLVHEQHGDVEYMADADAFEYRESESLSADEYSYVQEVQENARLKVSSDA